jgi:hypothetical protein
MIKSNMKCLLIGLCFFLLIAGCGQASKDNDDQVSTAQKKKVLEAIGKAYSDSKQEKNDGELDSKSKFKTVNCLGEGQSANTWISQSYENLGTENKVSYDHGTVAYDKTLFVGVNELDEEKIATFTTWAYEIDSNNVDEYQLNEFPEFTSSFHSLVQTNDGSMQISRMNGEVVYQSGIEFDIINASASIIIGNNTYTASYNYPFAIKYDSDNNGEKENYYGTFIANNINLSNENAYLQATITDENGAEYGIVKVFNDNTVEVSVAN